MPTRTKPAATDYADAAALREALRAFQRASESVTARYGLTSRTYQVLLMIKTGRTGKGYAGLGELEERLKLGRSTITELMLRTEERGLVRRELDPDRRGAIRIGLTRDGERRLANACAELGDERRRLLELVGKLN
jgi:DNA-binding MarR family transcriptional regulator